MTSSRGIKIVDPITASCGRSSGADRPRRLPSSHRADIPILIGRALLEKVALRHARAPHGDDVRPVSGRDCSARAQRQAGAPAAVNPCAGVGSGVGLHRSISHNSLIDM